MKLELEQGMSVENLVLISIELSLKSWINAHAKTKKKPKSIIEEVDKQQRMIEKYKKYVNKDR